jgi:thiol-disulfide isomerase/thioredoxin
MNRMSKVILIITLASVLTLGLAVSGCSGEAGQNGFTSGKITGISTESRQSPQVGELAPDFYFVTPEGESSSISQLEGQPVLINFWATWCSPCAYEMPHLEQFYLEQGDEVVLLTINVGDSASQVTDFMQSNNLSFTVLLDSNGNAAQRYNVSGIPTTFFIGSDGVIQGIKIGAFQSQAEIEAIVMELD